MDTAFVRQHIAGPLKGIAVFQGVGHDVEIDQNLVDAPPKVSDIDVVEGRGVFTTQVDYADLPGSVEKMGEKYFPKGSPILDELGNLVAVLAAIGNLIDN